MQRKIQLLVKILYGSPCISYNEPDNTDSHFEACKLYMYLSYVFNNRGQRTTKYFVQGALHEESVHSFQMILYFSSFLQSNHTLIKAFSRIQLSNKSSFFLAQMSLHFLHNQAFLVISSLKITSRVQITIIFAQFLINHFPHFFSFEKNDQVVMVQILLITS